MVWNFRDCRIRYDPRSTLPPPLLRSKSMLRTLLFPIVLWAYACAAQLPWMRQVELLCAYHRGDLDHHRSPEHEFYLFYGNDSVVQVWMADWEGAAGFDHSQTPVRLIRGFVNDFHCEPDAYGDDNGVTIYRLSESTLVWENRSRSSIAFTPDGTRFDLEGRTYSRIVCWNRIVHPEKKFHRWSSGCVEDPEP